LVPAVRKRHAGAPEDGGSDHALDRGERRIGARRAGLSGGRRITSRIASPSVQARVAEGATP